jgi:hypothetical protein
MKYITVKLTEDQARYIANVVEEAGYNPDYPSNDPANTFTMRVVNKIWKALAQAKS